MGLRGLLAENDASLVHTADAFSSPNPSPFHRCKRQTLTLGAKPNIRRKTVTTDTLRAVRTYADIRNYLRVGQLPFANPTNWIVALDILERILRHPLENMEVSFENFEASFPSSGPKPSDGLRFENPVMYRRWRASMVTLHMICGGTGDDWADLLCIGYRLAESGKRVGNLSDIRASLSNAGLEALLPREVVREVAIGAHEAMQGKERIRFRAACIALDLLRQDALVRMRGLLPPKPIGHLPQRTGVGNFVLELPEGLRAVERVPTPYRSAVRAVYSAATKLRLVDEDVSPAGLLDVITRDNHVFEDLGKRLSQTSISMYRQRAIRCLLDLKSTF